MLHPSASPQFRCGLAERGTLSSMKREALRVTSTIPVAPTTLYFAWVDSQHHSSMTGMPAKLEPEVGAKYSTCNGYVTGKLLILDLGRRIVMSWRTPDFPREVPDSRVEVHFETLGVSTRILVLHTEIPEGQSEQYKTLWNEKYIAPMRAYFSKFLPDPRNPPVRRIPPPPPDDDEDEDDDVSAKGGKGKAKLGAAARPSGGKINTVPVKSTQLGKGAAPSKGAPSTKAGPPPNAASGPSVHKADGAPTPKAVPATRAVPVTKAAPATKAKPVPAAKAKPAPAAKKAAAPAKKKAAAAPAKKPAAKKPVPKAAAKSLSKPAKKAGKKPAGKPAKSKKR